MTKQKNKKGRYNEMKKITVAFLFTLLLFFTFTSIGFSLSLENDLDPTSFKVKVLPWEQVNSILPKKSKFTIIDVESGLFFDVQRRAGNSHADVQPLTHRDTKIMKTIYNGKWSWRRRAIIVLTDDRMIAASMHGMPHGAGALQNGFPGHFCVHFSGSTTHGLKNADPAHKLMVLKAGGMLDHYLSKIDPFEMMQVLEVAINQRDEKIMNRIVYENDHHSFKKRFSDIQMIKFDLKPNSIIEEKQMVVNMRIPAMVMTCKNQIEKRYYDVSLWRDFGSGQWYFVHPEK